MRTSTLPREHAIEAMRAGGRFVANSPVLLEPDRARGRLHPPGRRHVGAAPDRRPRPLHLGSGGYGLLLGCVGVGALIAATYGPAVRAGCCHHERSTPGPRRSWPAARSCSRSPIRCRSTRSFSSLQAQHGSRRSGCSAPRTSPRCRRGQGPRDRFYQVAFQGSNAIGALGFGALAERDKRAHGLHAMAGLSVLALLTWPLPLPAADPRNVAPVDAWPLPDVQGNPDQVGPVLVIVEWPVRPEAEQEFFASARDLRRLRRRTGAVTWRLYRSTAHEPPRARRDVHPRHLGRARTPARAHLSRRRGGAGSPGPAARALERPPGQPPDGGPQALTPFGSPLRRSATPLLRRVKPITRPAAARTAAGAGSRVRHGR